MMKKAELGLVHEILPPEKSTEKPKMILLIHGYGSHEQDLFSFADSLNDKRFIISIRGPIQLPFGGFAWYNIDFSNSPDRWTDDQQAMGSIERIEQFIKDAVEAYDLSSEDICIMGFSQGSIISYSLLFRQPSKIRSLVAMSGYIHSPLLPERSGNDLLTSQVLMTHGTMDEVIPIQWARRSEEVLEKLKIPHQFREYPMGHGVSPQCFQDILRWMRDKNLI